MIGEGYAAIPSWILRDESISAPAVLVYASLASRAGFESIHPGQKIIAAEARCSERRVRDAIKELEERGLVERVERRFRSGQRASDGYVLHSGVRPNAVAELPWDKYPHSEQPAPPAGSEGQPADSDSTNRQIPANVPLIEITTKEIANVEPGRPDVEALLGLLDEEIRRNDARKIPKRNKANANAIRLLLDRDGYTAEEVASVIRWAQADQFWHTNILSASKLREKFATLDSQMKSGRGRSGSSSPASRVLDVDLGGSTGGAVSQPQIGRSAAQSIIGEIEGGRW